MDLNDYIDDEVQKPPVEEEPIEEIVEPIEETPEEVIQLDEDETNEVPDEGKVYFEALKNFGVLEVPEDFEYKSQESIDEALTHTKAVLNQKAIETIWQSLPDEFKPLLRYGLEGGTSLQDYLDAYAAKEIDYDLEDEISQRYVIREYYRQVNPKLSDEKLDQMVERRANSGALKEEAEDALEYLKELKEARKQELFEELEAQREEQLRVQQEREEAIKAKIDSFASDSIRRNRLKNFVFHPIVKNGTTTTEFNESLTSIMENHDHLVQLVDLLADYHPKNGFNLDRLAKRIKTDTTNTFKDYIKDKLDPKSRTSGAPSKGVKDDID